MILVALKWRRDAAGYRLEDTGPYGQSIVRNGGESVQTEPLADNKTLYAEFAGIETPERLLAFANRYGYLEHLETSTGGAFYQTDTGDLVKRDDGYDGELVSDGLEAAYLVRQVMIALNSGKKLKVADARELTRLLENNDVGSFRLAPDQKRGIRFVFEATSLMNAIWIQLAQKAAGGIEFGSCQYCGDWFEMGPGTGKRSDSDFCKTAHRVAFNRKLHRKEG